MTGKDQPYLSSFGRNRGRSLRTRQQGLVETLLPKMGITLSSPSLQGEEYTSVALEIGFGGGEHLAALAAHEPETLCIGCEPFLNGVAKLLVAVEEQGLSNIRVFTDDARKLVDALPEASVDRVFILFPDPWPKKRQQKRRLVNQDTLNRLARIHKRGGTLLLATDHADYATWMLEQLQQTPHYRWEPKSHRDWTQPPGLWVETKYQRKTTAEGRDPVFFHCTRT